ncbi:MAG: hypothetical protein COB58_09905 [Thalassobium sp.]|nr:MAG: hypothetical protein COB43_11805 [Oceanospirillales bacterium]PHQ85070.1 MAG: hypothetical protein COB58_09905 [Thalassobium sp.]
MKYFNITMLLPAFFCGSAFATTINCIPDEVGQYDLRVHIRCEQAVQDGSNSIKFFAVSAVGDVGVADTANRLLSVGMAALAAGKSVSVIFDAGDLSGESYGCGAVNCRKPRAFFLEKE